jgi:hypothetical protein
MKPACAALCLLAPFVLAPTAPASAQASPPSNEAFYARSLHFTTKGFAHWYSKEQGENVLFLVNHEGRVTAGTFLSYTYGKKTMITFGRSFSHSVVKQGRACAECHGTKNVAALAENRLRLMEWENGTIKTVQGVIPVADGARWNAVFIDRKGDQWVRLEGAAEPLIQYSAYCTPLSREQLARMRAAR